MPTIPRRADELTRVARSGTEVERSAVATDPDLPAEGQLAIVTAPEAHVAASILHNYWAGPEIIRALAGRHPDLRELAAGHPNAPVEMKDRLAIREHSDLAIDHYLVARRATPAQTRALKEHRDDPDPLGTVWETYAATAR